MYKQVKLTKRGPYWKIKVALSKEEFFAWKKFRNERFGPKTYANRVAKQQRRHMQEFYVW